MNDLTQLLLAVSACLVSATATVGAVYALVVKLHANVLELVREFKGEGEPAAETVEKTPVIGFQTPAAGAPPHLYEPHEGHQCDC